MDQMDVCLKDLICKNTLQKNYGQRLTQKVAAFKKELLKKIDSNLNLIINSENNNFYFNADAVDIFEEYILTECKSSIQLYNEFPFYYEFSGATEAEGKFNNMNCILAEENQYAILKRCILSNFFNIYDKRREVVVNWIEQECEQDICHDVQKSRTDVFQDKVICFKQSNEVYEAFVEIAKIDLMKENGGKDVKNLLQELPSNGTTLNKTCMPNCENCKNFDTCNQCETQYSLIDKVCQICHSTCLTCSESDYQLSCLTCKPGLALYYKQCIEKCPDGFMNLNGKCKQCEGGCKLCSEQSSNCIDCYDNLVLQDNKCISKCKQSFFLDLESEKCVECSSGCFSCQSKQNCNTCKENYLKQGEKCVEKCSENEINISGVCTNCNIKCNGCDGNPDKCIKCSQGFFMQDAVCVRKNQCKEGYYGDEIKRTCEKCHSNCKVCRGPSNSDCLTCVENSCVQQIFNQYQQVIQMNCILSITQNCEQCDEIGMCIKCKSPKLLVNNPIESNSCENSCPEDYYKQGETCEKNFISESMRKVDEEDHLSAMEIVFIIITIGLFIFISITLFCKFYNNKRIVITPNKQQPEIQQLEGIQIHFSNIGDIKTMASNPNYIVNLKQELKASTPYDENIEEQHKQNGLDVKDKEDQKNQT